MSLVLDRDTKPEGLSVSFPPWIGAPILLGDYEISLEDFLILAEYVLTNTDLSPDDPRLQFVKCIKSMKEVDGYNPGRRHLESSIPPIRESKIEYRRE